MSNAEVISRAEYDEAVATIADRDDRIELLESRIAKLQHMLFGRRSEKQGIPPGAPFQSELFTNAEFEVAEPEEEAQASPKKTRGKSKPHFSDDIEREIHDIEERLACSS